MRAFSLALLLVLTISSVTSLSHNRDFYEAKFVNWMKEHGKTYQTGEEFVRKLEVFSRNHDMIEEHNTKGESYSMSHNAYSDMTWPEFQAHFNLGRPMPADYQNKGGLRGDIKHTASSSSLPSTVDWESAGAVTPVKNQGSCGSCWSFSTTGSLEGIYEITNGNLVSFSEEMLVECDTVGNMGCNGGQMDWAFRWIESNGLCTEDDYPYTSSEGTSGSCKSSSCSVVSGSYIKSYTDVQESEDALMSAIAQQPVSVAIQANQLGFQFYSGGVFTGNCGTNLDHGVLTVGYGVMDGTDYWKVKNSWGDSWGSDGYIYLERGKDQEGGQCGILMSASYPSL